MARYVCSDAEHESQSHGWQVVEDGPGVMIPPGTYPACVRMVAGEVCRSFLRECSWCDKTATARGEAENGSGRLYACEYHARYLIEIALLPRCEECGDAVAWPTEWFCAACDLSIAMTEGASL